MTKKELLNHPGFIAATEDCEIVIATNEGYNYRPQFVVRFFREPWITTTEEVLFIKI